MTEGPNIARIAALIGDNARASMLSALMSGSALTATELADIAGVTRPTVSSHLAKLLEAELVRVERSGRHRYFRLAGGSVASVIESLMGLACHDRPQALRVGPQDPALRKARICYDHLAGELGVWLFESLLRQQFLQRHAGGIALSPAGQRWCRQAGIDDAQVAARRRAFCRECLDWSERRHHLAGALGAALWQRIEAAGWARRQPGSRVVSFTAAGEQSLRRLLEPQPP